MNDINSPHHPLYFHPNDHPGLLLISKRLLGSENYSTWKRSMLIALSAKNKLKLVNGEYEEPSVSSNLRAYWERANDMLIFWILNTISKQIDRHRIYQLANEIVDLKQTSCTIEIYYHKLKGLWDELDAIEAHMLVLVSVYVLMVKRMVKGNTRRLIQCLIGLDECYTNIRGQILLMQPLPTAAKAYTMLRQEEKQKETQKQHLNTPIALNTYRSSNSYSHNTSQTNNNHAHPNNHSTPKLTKGVYSGKVFFVVTVRKKVTTKKNATNYLVIQTVNMVAGETSNNGEPSLIQTSPLDSASTSTPNESLVYAEMDELQNQLN
ncbi:cysteine-rich receptor-like protein kinase 8 [Tanacetum coccineum]